MKALIVGGDYVKHLKEEITVHGLDAVEHWNGRKVGDGRRPIPRDTKVVLIMCDYVSHGISCKVKKEAHRQNLPVVYCKRSLGEVRKKLQRLEDQGILTDSVSITGAREYADAIYFKSGNKE